MLSEKIKETIDQINDFKISNKEELESFRLKFLSKKGLVNELFEDFKKAPAELKREFGKKLNEVKQLAQSRHKEDQSNLEETGASNATTIDQSLPGVSNQTGSRHPLSITENELINIFSKLGFSLATGPEVEDDWHNFSALNFPDNHPARDMQDTFFISEQDNIALRTHTSSVQVRVMENQKIPIRVICPGRVYRNEAISARANCFFHQLEGLYIDQDVSFADLKKTLFFFVQEYFGSDVKTRFRPSYFPFTEPSAEMDISCQICGGEGCNVCKYTGWVEILGCGMVDPNVLESSNIDSKKYSGFAFGMGVERIAMLKFGVKDLRTYFENDIRFLNQFKSS